jgi:hypothetical protein
VSAATGGAWAVLLLVQVPLALMWLFVLVDIARQPRMATGRKVLWALGCTVVWPVQVLYLLVRPQQGRAERELDRDDPHARLVDAALDREAGRIDAPTFSRIAGELRAAGGRG